MTVQDTGVIDFVGLDSSGETALLILVEERPWGTRGACLPALQDKLNTYFNYVAEGHFASDFPQVAGRSIRFVLKCAQPPTERELEFLEIVERRVLGPAGIGFSWELIAASGRTM